MARISRIGKLSAITAALLAAGAGLAGAAQAQIEVTPLGGGGIDAQALAAALLASNSGIEIRSASYAGAANASGLFDKGGMGAGGVGIDSGVLLTTGDVSNVVGPNSADDAGRDNLTAGSPLLDALLPGEKESFDAALLTITFVPTATSVQFNYVFGSEEYYEFVGKADDGTEFNDVFGFFVNGENCALIPGTETPVSINSVNNGNYDTGDPASNPQFFRENRTPDGPGTIDTQLDGLTTVLRFTAPVRAGQENTLVLGIQDIGDGAFDSAVFIQGGSFRVTEPAAAIPEPGTAALAASALLPLFGIATRRRSG